MSTAARGAAPHRRAPRPGLPRRQGAAARSPGLAAAAAAAALTLIPPVAVAPAAGQALRVGAEEAAFPTIAEALTRAGPGDTVLVGPGIYRERLLVRRPVTLVGQGWPVLDGGGRGHVVEAMAPMEIRGFVIRGSGTRPDREDAGIMVRGAPARVVGNRLEDVLFGVYLKEAPGSLVRGNRIVGKPLPLPRRGDAIRLWYSSGSRILENLVEGSRDVVVYFSDSLVAAGNVIRGGRYGLHYMYSDDNRFLRNRFEGNEVGAFIMYSRGIALRENVFAAARGGGGMGLGLKDADEILAEDNLFVENGAGVYLDNSPAARDVTNRFVRNLFLLNGTGVVLLPSVRGNIFRENDFIGNRSPVQVAGGTRPGQVAQNSWRGNYWDGYAGFDADDDGRGDTPFLHARLADDLVGRYPELRLFALSPALRLVDALGRFFPLLRPEPAVVDPAPLLGPRALPRWEEAPPVAPAPAPPGTSAPRPGATGSSGGRDGATGSILWSGVTLLALAALVTGVRLPRRPEPVATRRPRRRRRRDRTRRGARRRGGQG